MPFERGAQLGALAGAEQDLLVGDDVADGTTTGNAWIETVDHLAERNTTASRPT